MQKSTPVIAVIPNYNMANSLKELLPQVLAQGYDDIYVLDDASTDNSAEVVRGFIGVKLIQGDKNIGAGPNRNRIIGKLGKSDIIHFIDADMRLNTKNIPAIARKLMTEPGLGFIGGMIYNGVIYKKQGMPLEYNFGPRQSLRNNISAVMHLLILIMGTKLPNVEQWCRRNFKSLRAWPNPHQPPQRRRVLWTSEANMLVRAGTFEKLGGYDPNLRDHEILDLSLEAHARGLKNYFDPSFVATHTAVQVRQGRRSISRHKAEFYIIRKRGFKQWLSWSRKYEPAEQFLPWK